MPQQYHVERSALMSVARRLFRAASSLSVEPAPHNSAATVVYRVRAAAHVYYLRVAEEPGQDLRTDALVLERVRSLGASVPEVVHVEPDPTPLGRSFLVMADIGGESLLSSVDRDQAARAAMAAGRDAAIINSVEVDGFGWLRRDGGARFRAELADYSAFVGSELPSRWPGWLEPAFEGSVLDAFEALVEAERARPMRGGRLVHGDLDVTHIFQRDGRYSGIIDFGEMRGADAEFDLGHFLLHDCESLPISLYEDFLAGYEEVEVLDEERREAARRSAILSGLRQLSRWLRPDGNSSVSATSFRRSQLINLLDGRSAFPRPARPAVTSARTIRLSTAAHSPTRQMGVVLPNGLSLRRAVAEDLEGIAAVHESSAWLAPAFADPEIGPGSFTVVLDHDRIVSSLCLQRLSMQLSGMELPVASPEWVGTHPDYRNRGLVRAQLEEVHRWSRERGDLAQVIGGIPFFYRQFGYAYAIGLPPLRALLPATTLPEAGDWSIRQANEHDAPDVASLQDAQQHGTDLISLRTTEPWSSALGGNAEWLVAERAGEVGGVANLSSTPGVEGQVHLRGVAASHPQALYALLRHARQAGTVVVMEARPSLSPLLEPVTVPHAPRSGLYARVESPAALLDHLRSVLARRLASSEHATSSGTLRLSTYRSTITLGYDHGDVGQVHELTEPHNPAPSGNPAVPPDHLAELIFGRWGAKGLAARYDDVDLGTDEHLMQVLFPRLSLDLT